MIDAAVGRRTGRAAGVPARVAAYGAAAAAFAAYAVWGSLFPFDFQRAPIADLVALSDLWSAHRSPLSLTDLVSNVLLFLPIGLFAAAFVETRARASSAAALAGVFACAVALSAGVEIGQAFVPARTPSMLDVLAETAGAALGLALWRIVGAELDDLLRLVVHRVRRATPAERALLGYVVLFAVWWWLPGDFTLRPGEIADKFEHKRLLLPFVPSPDAVSPSGLIAIAAAAIPVGLAAALCGRRRDSRRSIAKALALATLFFIGLEAGQTLVFSRTTDAAAALEAIAGAALGALVARRSQRPYVDRLRASTVATAACVAVWITAAAICAWWPFAVDFEPERALRQMTRWSLAPFRPPLRAADVAPGVALAIAAGLLVRGKLSLRFIRLQALGAVAFIGAIFLALEAGRILLAGASPTLVTVLVECVAFVAALLASPSVGSALVRRTESC